MKAVEALRAELEEEEQAMDGSDASADDQQAEVNSVHDADRDIAEPDQQEQEDPGSAALDSEPDEQPSQQAAPLCKLPGSCFAHAMLHLVYNMSCYPQHLRIEASTPYR